MRFRRKSVRPSSSIVQGLALSQELFTPLPGCVDVLTCAGPSSFTENFLFNLRLVCESLGGIGRVRHVVLGSIRHSTTEPFGQLRLGCGNGCCREKV